MGLLDSIFNNEKVLKTAFGMVKKLFTENDIQLVTLELGPDGEVLPQLYKDEKPVVIEQSKMTKIEQICADYVKENAELREKLSSLTLVLEGMSSAVAELPEPGPIVTETDMLTAQNAINGTDQQAK